MRLEQRKHPISRRCITGGYPLGQSDGKEFCMKILLAVDDSKFSEAALRMLVAQNQPSQIEVRLLHVVEPISGASDLMQETLGKAHDLVSRLTQEMQQAGFRTENGIETGHVGPTIVEVAAQWQADLIVIGARGSGSWERQMWGSVSEYVARRCFW
jgi:nucleotide-binding universal stress UspA family protein